MSTENLAEESHFFIPPCPKTSTLLEVISLSGTCSLHKSSHLSISREDTGTAACYIFKYFRMMRIHKDDISQTHHKTSEMCQEL